jgi:hypothetical protein
LDSGKRPGPEFLLPFNRRGFVRAYGRFCRRDFALAQTACFVCVCRVANFTACQISAAEKSAAEITQ